MTRRLELRRHGRNDGDVLTAEGIRAAVELGATLKGPYTIGVSSGAQRATQTLACLLAGYGQPVLGGVRVEPALRSVAEDRWIEAYRRAGSGELSALFEADPKLVDEDVPRLADGLRNILASLPDDGTALVVAHGATTEAAVFGLTGVEVPPLTHCAGVAVAVSNDGSMSAEVLD